MRSTSASTSTRRSTCTSSASRRTRCARAWPRWKRCSGASAPQPPQAALIAVDPAHRRDPRVGGRPVLQPVAVQPRPHGAPPAGVGLQAVRLPRRVREGRARTDAPTSRRPPSSWTSRRRSGSRTRRTSRRNYEDSYDGPITLRRALAHSKQLGDGEGGRDGRLRHGGGPVEEVRHVDGAEAVPVDRARVVRGDAVRDRDGLHGLPEPRQAAAAARDPPDQRGLQAGGEAAMAGAEGRSRGPTRPSSSRT